MRYFLLVLLAFCVGNECARCADVYLENRRKAFRSVPGSTLNIALRFAYTLNEASGAQRNDSAGASHLADNGTVGAVAAKISNGAVFTGGSSFLSCADTVPLSWGLGMNFSYSFFFKAPSGGGQFGLISKWDDSGGDNEILIYYDGGSDQLVILLFGNDNIQYGPFLSADTVAADAVAHVAIVYDGSTIKIHINNDGSPSSTAHTQGVRDSTSTFRVGIANAGGAWPHASWIDELFGWAKAISTTEITSLYNDGNGITCCPFAGLFLVGTVNAMLAEYRMPNPLGFSREPWTVKVRGEEWSLAE